MRRLLAFLAAVLLAGMTVPALGQQTGGPPPDSARTAVTGYGIVGTAPTGMQRARQRIANIRGRGAAQQPVIYLLPAASGPATALPIDPQRTTADPLSAQQLQAIQAALANLQRQQEALVQQQRRLDQREQVVVAPTDLGPLQEQLAIQTRLLEEQRAALERQQRLIEQLLARQDQPVIRDTVVVERTPEPAVQPPPPTPPVDTGPPTFEERVRVIERALLETGLFRTIDILFEVDESTLLPNSRVSLNAVGEVLEKYPDLQLEVVGHTDSTGPDAYNQRLSEDRAASVRAYLVEQFGIEGERIGTRGLGESQPIADNSTVTGRTLNRRVEFRVIE